MRYPKETTRGLVNFYPVSAVYRIWVFCLTTLMCFSNRFQGYVQGITQNKTSRIHFSSEQVCHEILEIKNPYLCKQSILCDRVQKYFTDFKEI